MPTTYPGAPPTAAGQNITADRLVNSPVLVQRLLRTLVQQRLIGDQLLTGRVDLTGSGSAVFEIAEAILADMPAERVAALAEYPLTTDTPSSLGVATTDKWALATEYADEIIARQRLDIVTRKLIKLANRIAFQFDALVLSAIGSAVTQEQPASSAWNTANADPLLDLLLGAAQSDNLNQGYVIDTFVCRPTYFARFLAAAKIIERAPREGDNAILLTGNIQQVAGLTILKSTNLPTGTNVMAVDSTQLGSIAFEDIGGGYVGPADGVQSKTFRLETQDGFRTQARRIGVPMVQEPGAAVKITGV